MAALEGYIVDTSAALFSLGAGIAGHSSDEIEHLANHAGLAQGLAQVLAALPRDASRRQLFVPRQLLQRHGVEVEDVFAGKETPPLRAALNDLIGAGARSSEHGFGAAGASAARGEAGVSAAGAGGARSQAEVARGLRSLCAASGVAAADAVDAVARLANAPL